MIDFRLNKLVAATSPITTTSSTTNGINETINVPHKKIIYFVYKYAANH